MQNQVFEAPETSLHGGGDSRLQPDGGATFTNICESFVKVASML